MSESLSLIPTPLTTMLQDRTWLLIGRKMANEASPQETTELEEILKANPELHFSLQVLTELWQQSHPQDINEIETAYLGHLERMRSELSDHPGCTGDLGENSTLFTSPRQSFLRKNKIATVGIPLFLGIIAAAIFYSNPSKTPSSAKNAKLPASEISTRNGSKTNIILPDGTRVWLNAGSKLTYDKNFGESLRQVRLTGEAYFNVVHNAEKPFIIHTSAMDIKVLGTEFNVKSYPDENITEASLIRGSIEVTLKDKRAEKIIMKPNEKLMVSNENELEIKTTSPALKTLTHSAPIISLKHLSYSSFDSTILETSWVNNRLEFEDESFEDVARMMSRWYGVEFEFKDAEIEKLRFTGKFKNETVQEALKAMQITANFNFRISSDKHIIIANK